MAEKPHFESAIWLDEPQEDDPFTAKASYCHGYDVFGQLIQKASFIEYLLLMFLGEKPTKTDAKLFETLAISLANLGPRDASVRAAMNAAVGGAPAASALISALAIGAGQTGGCREVFTLTRWFERHGLCIKNWLVQLQHPNSDRLREDIWDNFQHAPGFKPHGVSFSQNMQELLDALSTCGNYPTITWLNDHRHTLEHELGSVMGHTFIAAGVFHELGFSAQSAEICALLLILPGAAVHALEAKEQGWRKFPFFGQSVELTDDPGVIAPLPDIKEVGI
jgi:citrate synthase